MSLRTSQGHSYTEFERPATPLQFVQNYHDLEDWHGNSTFHQHHLEITNLSSSLFKGMIKNVLKISFAPWNTLKKFDSVHIYSAWIICKDLLWLHTITSLHRPRSHRMKVIFFCFFFFFRLVNLNICMYYWPFIFEIICPWEVLEMSLNRIVSKEYHTLLNINTKLVRCFLFLP